MFFLFLRSTLCVWMFRIAYSISVRIEVNWNFVVTGNFYSLLSCASYSSLLCRSRQQVPCKSGWKEYLYINRLYINKKWSVLRNLNIPHDPPSILGLGNLGDTIKDARNVSSLDLFLGCCFCHNFCYMLIYRFVSRFDSFFC